MRGGRFSERLIQASLWLVAVAFATFLIGLGGKIIADLPRVDHTPSLSEFVDPEAGTWRAARHEAQNTLIQAQDAVDRAKLLSEAAAQATRSARETFQNWIATRHATQQSGQDAELIARTSELDTLRSAQRLAEHQLELNLQTALAARQAMEHAQRRLDAFEVAATAQLDRALRKGELRVFAYRLALTLPLLVLAGWLFVHKRKSAYWAFVWGFVFFAVFAFFVELVPYLPSYGGYVRYIVGLFLTVLAGRFAVRALVRYRERQKVAEQRPPSARRREIGYDAAQIRLAKSLCPGCERHIDLKDPGTDFCPHCGVGVFDHCSRCATRKSAFTKFCHACGADTGGMAGPEAGDPLSSAGNKDQP